MEVGFVSDALCIYLLNKWINTNSKKKQNKIRSPWFGLNFHLYYAAYILIYINIYTQICLWILSSADLSLLCQYYAGLITMTSWFILISNKISPLYYCNLFKNWILLLSHVSSICEVQQKGNLLNTDGNVLNFYFNLGRLL